MDQQRSADDEGASQPAPQTPAPRASTGESKPSLEGGVKDTIESILVAFILAFIFRAFVVEAFVIPTGSMAPTLLGAHMRFRCPDCGYRFDVNFQGTDSGDDVIIPSSAGRDKVFAIFCPNCGYRMPRSAMDDPVNDATDPPVRYGDRILVLKYLYLFQDPKRWDVVVFKSPNDPAHFDYTQNYIKRLVGEPGETIMILDGDVYVSTSKSDDRDELLHSFKVQTKPRRVQDALWRIVYDNDYYPRGLGRSDLRGRNDDVFSDPPFEQPWKQQPGQTGWTIGDGTPGHRDFVFDNPSGNSAIYFDANADPKKFALTDWLAYDVTDNQQGPNADLDTYETGGYDPQAVNNVSDVKLEFTYQRMAGDGPLAIELTKRDHVFQAQLMPNQAILLMDGKPLGNPVALPAHAGPMHVEMMNVDYRVSLRTDGREILASTPEQYHPDLDKLMAEFRSTTANPPRAKVRVIGQNQTARLTHMSLWRDVYYLNRDKYRQPLKHATPYDFPDRLMRLKPDQFFVLGDNSYVSLDARYWDDPIELPREGLSYVQSGVVPRRFMLGKAFFVYWPAGFRPIPSAPALVPDFGDMRFIH